MVISFACVAAFCATRFDQPTAWIKNIGREQLTIQRIVIMYMIKNIHACVTWRSGEMGPDWGGGLAHGYGRGVGHDARQHDAVATVRTRIS